MLEPEIFSGLISGGWREVVFGPFREGVLIHRFYEHPEGAAAALLRYTPGASVPRHEHLGFEHVQVLDGEQSDERGTYAAGTLVINPPGSVHRVWSVPGCTALLIWERPVRFLTGADA